MAAITQTSAKLTDTHLVILSAAAGREDGRVLPVPESVGNKGGGATRALKGLLRRELIAEILAGAEDTEWSRSDDGERLTLAITGVGLAAIGVESEDTNPTDGNAEPETTIDASVKKGKRSEVAPEHNSAAGSEPIFREGTKGAAIVELLRCKDGATVPDMMDVSGWQAHSIRGFLSGTLKKKHGFTIESEKGEDGLRRYRIAS